NLAKQAFAWLDNVAHDPEHGGYFGLCQRDGKPILSADQNPGEGLKDYMNVPLGFKDANTNGDMLQAIGDLYQVFPDASLDGRLHEMVYIARDRMFVPPGALHEYFHPDWTPVPDVTRYCQAIHASNILAKASSILGLDSDPKTQRVIKSVIDTLLRYAWDCEKGGFFSAGPTFGPAYIDRVQVFVPAKPWWAQAEGLRALLRLTLLYPEDETDYLRRFNELWTYITKYDRLASWRLGALRP